MSNAFVDLAGNALNGDWQNGKDVFPLGDGVAGAKNQIRFRRTRLTQSLQQLTIPRIRFNRFASNEIAADTVGQSQPPTDDSLTGCCSEMY